MECEMDRNLEKQLQEIRKTKEQCNDKGAD